MTGSESADKRITQMGLILPPALSQPKGGHLPFAFVNVVGNRAMISGHLPQEPDGSIARYSGKVGDEISIEEAQLAARKVGLSMLASLQRELGSLERIKHWMRLFGMVNVASGFVQLPQVINGCSELLLEVLGDQRGVHARSAIGVAELPLGVPVEIEGEVLLND